MAKGWDNTISWTSCLSKPTQLPDQVQHELPAKPAEAKLLTAAPQLDPLHQQGGYPSFSSTKKTADPQLAMAKLKNKPVRSSVGRGSARGSPGCRGVFYRRSRPKYVRPEGL